MTQKSLQDEFIDEPTERTGKDRFFQVERIGRVRVLCRNNKYYIRWYERHPRRTAKSQTQRGQQPSLGTYSTIDEAREAARGIDRQLQERGATGYTGREITVAEAIEKLVALFRKDSKCSPKTAISYAARWEHLKVFCDAQHSDQSLCRIKPEFLVDFERWLQARKVSPNGHPNAAKRALSVAHRKNILEAAGTLFEKAKQQGWVPDDVTNPFRTQSHGRRQNTEKFQGFEKGSIDDEFLNEFLAACDAHWRRVFLLMLSSGLRTDEVRHMLCEKIDWQRACYVLDPMVEELGWNTKNGRWRLIPILSQTRPLFESLWRGTDNGGVLVRNRLRRRRAQDEPAFSSTAAMIRDYQERVRQFTATHGQAPTPADQERLSEQVFRANWAMPKDRIYKEFRHVLKKLGADRKVWPHLTRHFTASQAHQAGVDRFVSLSVMGHSNICTFDGYCEQNLPFMQKEWAKVLENSNPVMDALAQLAAAKPSLIP